jgi:hypothetical protein
MSIFLEPKSWTFMQIRFKFFDVRSMDIMILLMQSSTITQKEENSIIPQYISNERKNVFPVFFSVKTIMPFIK